MDYRYRLLLPAVLLLLSTILVAGRQVHVTVGRDVILHANPDVAIPPGATTVWSVRRKDAWIKVASQKPNQQPVTDFDDSPYKARAQMFNGSSLKIKHVTLEDNNAEFRCRITRAGKRGAQPLFTFYDLNVEPGDRKPTKSPTNDTEGTDRMTTHDTISSAVVPKSRYTLISVIAAVAALFRFYG